MSECKHNWEQDHHLKIYVTCSICGERWNVERLVNYLQSKTEENADLRANLAGALGKYNDLMCMSEMAAQYGGNLEDKLKFSNRRDAIAAEMVHSLDTTPTEAYEQHNTQLSILQEVANAASAVMDVLGNGNSVEPGDAYYESLRIALDHAGWDESDAAERVQGLVEALELITIVPGEQGLQIIDSINKICSIAQDALQRYRGEGQ